MDLNIKDKVAIITGGSSGLGAAAAEVLAEEGTNIVITDITESIETFNFVEKLNKKYGIEASFIYGDITKPEDIDGVIEYAGNTYGKIDFLINNAGLWPTAFVKDMSDEEWEKTIKINLSGAFFFSKRIVKHFIKNKTKGKIINIVSQAAFNGSTSGHAHYASAKGGLVTFTVSLAREVAQYGVNVNAVAPGMMKTPMNKKVLAERKEDYLKRIPLGRIADPREVAYTIAFLVSDKADYITGATVDVTGGMLMR